MRPKLDLVEQLMLLQTALAQPKPGDWLHTHPEPGQTFQDYVLSSPAKPVAGRRFIYIQPLGEFSPAQRKITAATAEFLKCYYDLDVRTMDSLASNAVPDTARRTHPEWGMEQLLTGYILDEILKPRLPKDAAACIALTSSDLWPGQGWNFVFGQASTVDRVGVWSLYRNGDPASNDQAYRLCLMRTIKTASHEVGHMFGMRHCTRYACNMNGSNSREESDRKPLWLCADCVAKVCWAVGVDPIERLGALLEFSARHGFRPEEQFYLKSINTLRADDHTDSP